MGVVVLETFLSGLTTWECIGFPPESHCLYFYQVMAGCSPPQI